MTKEIESMVQRTKLIATVGSCQDLSQPGWLLDEVSATGVKKRVAVCLV